MKLFKTNKLNYLETVTYFRTWFYIDMPSTVFKESSNLLYVNINCATTFLANVTFTFAICHRPSICRLSVTFVHPTQAIEIFGNVSMPFGTLAIPDISLKILRR